MSDDEKREVGWFPGWWTIVITLVVIISLAFVISVVFNEVTYAIKFGQDYCDTLSGDAGETFVAASDHFCEYNCYYNVTKTPDGKYPPCKDHGYTFNRTAFLSALEHTI